MQTKRVQGIQEVEEIFDIFEQGTTLPVKCRLKNGMDVVVKYMRNPMGQQVLFNEWVGSNIADRIGLTIPEYGICNLSESAISCTNCNEEIDCRNAGQAFFTKYYSKSTPISRGLLEVADNKETELIMLFDHIVNNNDRHMGNLLVDIRKGARIISIDNSHIISLEPRVPFVYEELLKDEEILSNRILKSNSRLYDLLCTTIGYSEAKLKSYAKDIKSMLTKNWLLSVRGSIPSDWVNSIGVDKAERLFIVLENRISRIDEIVEMIIRERRGQNE